jgi:hypothetical protein
MSKTRPSWLAGLGITLAGLAFRLPWALQPRAVRWDEADYLLLARHWLDGLGYQVFGVPDLVWPPGAPLMAAASMVAGVPVDYALAVWQVLAGALVCGVLFGLARDVTGNGWVAAGAGLLAAASPALATWPLYWGSLTMPGFLLFLLAGLWIAWRLLSPPGATGGERPAWRAGLMGAAAGVAFGAAALIRSEGLFWWALFLVILAAAALWRRRGWLPVLLMALAFMLVIAPYVAYLSRHTGHLMLSGKTGLVMLLTPPVLEQGGLGQDYTTRLDSSGREILWLSPEKFDVSLSDFLLDDPRATLRLVRLNLALAAEALVDPLLGYVLLGLAGLGLFGAIWTRRRWAGEAFWLASLLPLTVLFVTKVETRYLVPLVPVALVWAGWGVVNLAAWAITSFENVSGKRLAAPLLIGPLLFLLLALGFAGQRQAAAAGQASLTPSHQEAGLWLAAHAGPNDPIMSRSSTVALYADRPLVAFPNATWPEVLAYGQARHMRYLVTDDWELTELRPQLDFLLDPSLAPPELEHVATFDGPRRTTLIYRVRE